MDEHNAELADLLERIRTSEDHPLKGVTDLSTILLDLLDPESKVTSEMARAEAARWRGMTPRLKRTGAQGRLEHEVVMLVGQDEDTPNPPEVIAEAWDSAAIALAKRPSMEGGTAS
jgi:hypothetical protein